MIRTIIAVIATWSFAGALCAECVSPMPTEVSSHLRVSVVLGGKPLKGARVVFTPLSGPGCACGTDIWVGSPVDIRTITDENGIVVLPELAPGNYEIDVTVNGVASAAIPALHVSSSSRVTTVPLDLTYSVQRLEWLPVRDHVEAFRGSVVDPGGAVIAQADIVVVKKESIQDLVLTGKTDETGHFSAELAEGSYLAVFYSRGFRLAIIPFEIVKGSSRELPVTLKIGAC